MRRTVAQVGFGGKAATASQPAQARAGLLRREGGNDDDDERG